MGRKGGSGISGGGGARGGGGGVNIDRAIERTPFTNEGGGNWQLDIPGVGGGQILDETGGSRDPMNGRGGKVYSARAWDSGYSMIENTQYLSSLNDAKRVIRDTLHRQYGNFG